MLDDFASTKLEESKQAQATPPATEAPSQSGPGRPEQEIKSEDGPSVPGEEGGEDFTAQLQAGFAEMMKDLESNPDMAKQFEELMSQFGGAPGGPPGAVPTPGTTLTADSSAATSTPLNAANAQKPPQPAEAPRPSAGAAKGQDENFQDTIRRTMDRMKQSDSSATAPANPGDDDMMASLLKELGGAGGGGDDDFSKMLLGMMEQLTNKEILYEPMKELDTKFPDWMDKNASGLNREDRERYETQQGLVKEIVGRFEKDGYADSNAADREFIVERMQKVS